jgi:hypothetical protein
MANVLKHRFASAKTDGTDATQVQPSHWNDGHLFTGGNAGDVLTRDPIDASFGAKWTPPLSTALHTSSGSHTGAATVLAGYSFLAGQLGATDAIDINVVAAVSGPVTVPPDLDIIIVGEGRLILITGATGIGDITSYATGQSLIRLRQESWGSQVLSQITGGVTVGAQQVIGRSAVAVAPGPSVGWTGAWGLWFRDVTGLPAGSSLVWGWQIHQRH